MATGVTGRYLPGANVCKRKRFPGRLLKQTGLELNYSICFIINGLLMQAFNNSYDILALDSNELHL
jgi:ABC-type sulfate transport system permease subunit